MAAQKEPVASRPPMGWNSWDCYAAAVTEAQLLANAAYMRDHLLQYGWEYVVCDIQWAEPLAGTGEGEYRPMAPLCMDEYGRLIPAENRFPSSAGGRGFGPVAEKIHGMGLKFGIHIMRGLPRQAAYARLPVKGSNVTADAIVDPFSVCAWNSDMYGVDHRRQGAQEYYHSLFELYGGWGVDFVKVDDICNRKTPDPYSSREEIEMIKRAIDTCGRPMVFSVSPGPAPVEEAWHLTKHTNMWRITDDFWDEWPALLNMFRRCEVWQGHGGEGHWPDCDMLPLGHIGMGFGKGRMTRFTKEEQVSMMTLWCIARSPLMVGGELNHNDAWTLSLLTNREALKANQEAYAPRQVERGPGHILWRSDGPDGDGYIAVFNLLDQSCSHVLDAGQLSLPPDATLRDVWRGMNLAFSRGALTVLLPPHGCILLYTERGCIPV